MLFADVTSSVKRESRKVRRLSGSLSLAGSPSPSLLRKSTSPKGRGLGKEMKFVWTAKGSHFGGAGIA